MNALPATTTYVLATGDSTHYLLDIKRIGLIDVTLRLPHDNGPHPAVLVSFGVTGAEFTDATTVACALTEAGFATVLFGRDVTGPSPSPIADWRRVLSWSAAHADLRADALAAWGFGRDADDVRRLVDNAPAGLRAGIAVLPEPERTGPLRGTSSSRVPLMITVSTLEARQEQRARKLARGIGRVQWARYRMPAHESFEPEYLPLLLADQTAFLRRHLART